MLLEALAAALVGLAGLWLVLQPLLASGRRVSSPVEPLDPEETPRGIALAALKEIDFDRETGKLSEGDYEFLKAKYTKVALETLRTERHTVTPDGIEAIVAAKVRTIRSAGTPQPPCATCGPRPEPDAVFCSTCGLHLATASISDAVPLTTTRAPASA
jgi:hypothetical protein